VEFRTDLINDGNRNWGSARDKNYHCSFLPRRIVCRSTAVTRGLDKMDFLPIIALYIPNRLVSTGFLRDKLECLPIIALYIPIS
jgi:hypothetical protein